LEKISWNEIAEECYDESLTFLYPIVVVKVIYADDKTERAVILQQPDGTYLVTFEKLYPYDDDELQYIDHRPHSFWIQSSQGACSIFDTEERAENAIFETPPFRYKQDP